MVNDGNNFIWLRHTLHCNWGGVACVPPSQPERGSVPPAGPDPQRPTLNRVLDLWATLQEGPGDAVLLVLRYWIWAAEHGDVARLLSSKSLFALHCWALSGNSSASAHLSTYVYVCLQGYLVKTYKGHVLRKDKQLSHWRVWMQYARCIMYVSVLRLRVPRLISISSWKARGLPLYCIFQSNHLKCGTSIIILEAVHSSLMKAEVLSSSAQPRQTVRYIDCTISCTLCVRRKTDYFFKGFVCVVAVGGAWSLFSAQFDSYKW